VQRLHTASANKKHNLAKNTKVRHKRSQTQKPTNNTKKIQQQTSEHHKEPKRENKKKKKPRKSLREREKGGERPDSKTTTLQATDNLYLFRCLESVPTRVSEPAGSAHGASVELSRHVEHWDQTLLVRTSRHSGLALLTTPVLIGHIYRCRDEENSGGQALWCHAAESGARSWLPQFGTLKQSIPATRPRDGTSARRRLSNHARCGHLSPHLSTTTKTRGLLNAAR